MGDLTILMIMTAIGAGLAAFILTAFLCAAGADRMVSRWVRDGGFSHRGKRYLITRARKD
jgi:hypothetical protein